VTGRHYLNLDEVLALHARLLERYGGASGIRDQSALESALSRPQSGYYPDSVAEAAALLESLAMNHPCVDGNKRIAFAATDVFLRINGYRIQRAPMAIYSDLLHWLEAGAFDKNHLEPWLRQWVSPAT
jgi:death-on-curing protein